MILRRMVSAAQCGMGMYLCPCSPARRRHGHAYMPMPRKILFLLVIGLLPCVRSGAQPAPSLSGVLPVYLRQGESREITLSGRNLAAAIAVAMPDAAGVTATLLPAEKSNTPRHLKLS